MRLPDCFEIKKDGFIRAKARLLLRAKAVRRGTFVGLA